MITDYQLTAKYFDDQRYIVVDADRPGAIHCPRLSLEDAKDLADELNRNSAGIRFTVAVIDEE